MNELARLALATKQAAYPVGSMIVREKLKTADASKPQMLTVMMKREAGFNPAAADWEFLIVNGRLTKVVKRQKEGDCLACHNSAKETDFVFQKNE